MDHRPGGRRAQRLRPPPGHRRDRVGPGAARQGGRGGGGGLPAPHHGPGHLRLRDPDGRRGRHRRAEAGAGRPGAQGDRPHRQG